jgi:hypothetical protein
MKHRFNTEQLANIHSYHNKLAQEIDEAEWMGDFTKSDFMRDEYDHITDLRNKGDTWYPLF